MNRLSQSALALSIWSILTNTSWAEQQSPVPVELATITVTAQSDVGFIQAEQTVKQAQLQQSASTLGDALQNELSVSSSGFGAGASRPVIRGQEGARLKVTSNASDTMDVSSLSPDHVVTIDPQLSEKIEVIRGPASLLYAAGSVGGLVNVTDGKIPTQMPEKGYEAQVGVRYNTGNDEKLVQAGATVALGSNVALRVEGLKRDANNYIAPNYIVTEDHGDHVHQNKERRVDNTFAESENFNLGLSWIGERGFAGMAYSKRKDQYGLPGHSHEYEDCHLHGMSLHCGGHGHDDHEGEGHEGAGHGHDHDEDGHAHGGPWIDLVSERYDFRSELNDPFHGFSTLRFQASYTDYRHDEIEEGNIATRFESKAYDGRLELEHQTIAGWDGLWGVQASQQKLNLNGEEAILAPNKTHKYSLFGLEKNQWKDLRFELGTRVDYQKNQIDSDQKDFSGTAFSYSGATHWDFAPDYTLSLTASHQERLPLAQELYSDGKHFATNTYEKGNQNLNKEQSNNLELGLNFDNQQLSYKVNLYHNWFDDYIYAQTLDRYKDFRLIEYNQDSAKFYGLEGKVAYQLNPVYNVGLFGDYVRGKIDNDNAPRVPAGRVGTRVDAAFDDHWAGSAEFYHVFEQDKISAFESATDGYNMLNLGLSYTGTGAGKYKAAQEYRVFFNANNLLDQQVYQHASFLPQIPQMGRNFMMGVNLNF
ncbi:iron complex outermembrane receptor protein [Acinetobacter calcoaceticus]|uniref:Iron complex outermembrane receptor protein n=1 Tax=Acinetobacter calcoaceticus TaxID=471 RepID=A0A4V2R1E4_ACICA|nr:iron complex outermembrane receptor protein [Acinetobacter calcoaceticus]